MQDKFEAIFWLELIILFSENNVFDWVSMGSKVLVIIKIKKW